METKNYWNTTRKLLLVINFESLENVHEYRDAIKAAGLNINDCMVLAIVGSKKERQMLTEIHSVTYASDKEINILGRWKNEDISKVLNEVFDTMIVFGEHVPKVKKQLKRMRAHIKVGINTSVNFLTIDLKSEQNAPRQLLNFAKTTLEKIN
ncbi:MAG: hypothetical protein NXI10_12700 [bacterium]|nr:hypothetical protein [bacterium]